MKVKELIKKLQKLDDNSRVVIDFDPEVGWFELEEVKLVTDPDDGEVFVNIKSSNES